MNVAMELDLNQVNQGDPSLLIYMHALTSRRITLELGGGQHSWALGFATDLRPFFVAAARDKPTARLDVSERAYLLTVPFQVTVKSSIWRAPFRRWRGSSPWPP